MCTGSRTMGYSECYASERRFGELLLEINQESLYKTDEQGHFIAEKPASRVGKIPRRCF